MGKVQIKKKSMFIDMTAMSDVTVLLLTFFMLTGNFIKKEFRNQDSGNEHSADSCRTEWQDFYES